MVLHARLHARPRRRRLVNGVPRSTRHSRRGVIAAHKGGGVGVCAWPSRAAVEAGLCGGGGRGAGP